MEVVKVFNNELSSLYDVKPPISKAKMTQITKSAIKGLKFYKHIVQSVEKFIQKCRPEYKVPGLYVVDSIVRQSRHQFGSDKDVFAPRFMKNIVATFQNLFKCPEEDRPRIVRVLNLWQKNNVFPSDVIQPLLDMAVPNAAGEWSFDNTQTNPNNSPVRKAAPQPVASELTPNSKHKSAELSAWKGWPQTTEEQPVESHGFSEMSTKNVEKFTKANSAGVADNVIQTAKNSDVKVAEEKDTVKFNKKLLDFDYGDEEDEEEIKTEDGQSSLAYSISQNLLSNPELLRQLQQMQQTIQQNESLKSELAMQSQPAPQKENKDIFSPVVTECKVPPNPFLEPPPQIPPQQQPPPSIIPYSYDGTGIAFPPPPTSHMPLLPDQQPMDVQYQQHPMLAQEALLIQSSQVDEDDRQLIYSMPGEPPLPPQDLDERALVIPGDDRVKKERSRSRSGSRSRGRTGRHRSRSRSPRRRKSRSRSRSRSRRNRSRSKDRDRERQKERERERERERDRRKKGIPPVKKNCVSVCSTTLWLGHVPKTLSEDDIGSTFMDYGSVLTIDMIPPRGCAYVVMDRRQDAHRALQKLKNLKLQGSSIKMAWAPGKGTKGKEFKDYWEVDLGVSYIPFEKISNDLESLDALEEGGFIDEESLPSHLRELRQQRDKKQHSVNESHLNANINDKAMEKNNLISQAPAPTMPPTMLPTTMGLPVVLPQMLQPQFGMPLPGLLPPQPMVVQHMPMPVGVPPPNPLMMVQPPSQNMLAGTPMSVPQMSHLTLPHPSVALTMSHVTASSEAAKESLPVNTLTASDATPTDEDGTRVSSPPATLQTLSTSIVSSSAPSTVTQDGVMSFNTAIGLHSVQRQSAPGVPPVSTSNSLPFPPPPHGIPFGFPPPGLRPGAPGQNMPVVSLNSAFPWQKPAVPNFNFSEADVRFSAPAGITTSNTRPMGQPNKVPNVPISIGNRPLVPGSGNPAVPSKDLMNQGPLPGVTNKEIAHHMEHRNNDAFNNRHNMQHKMFNRPLSPGPYDIHDMDIDPADESREILQPTGREDFPRDDMTGIPRFPGPQDFHRGGMRGRWMHGPPPGNMAMPRFPRGMQFPPRGGPRGAFPRMEMEYFPPQGPPPPGPRMHAMNQRGHQPRRGGHNFPPPRGPDHFSNRGDFYEEPHFEDDDRNRGYKPREEWNNRRDQWEEQSRWNEEENKFPPRYEREKTEQRDEKPEMPKPYDNSFRDIPDKKDINVTASDNPDKSEVKPTAPAQEESKKPKPKPKTKPRDAFSDMCRLKNYIGSRRYNRPPIVVPPDSKSKKEEKKADPEPKPETVVEKDKPCESEGKEKGETKLELNPTETQVTLTNNNEPHTGVSENVQELRTKRERDRKRSRWGRTHSEEREFQQQKVNELEMKFQNCEQTSDSNANLNGTVEISDSTVASVSLGDSTDMFSDSFKDSMCSEDSTAVPVQNNKAFVEVGSEGTDTTNNVTSSDVTEPIVEQDQTCIINNVNLETNENTITATTTTTTTTGPAEPLPTDVTL